MFKKLFFGMLTFLLLSLPAAVQAGETEGSSNEGRCVFYVDAFSSILTDYELEYWITFKYNRKEERINSLNGRMVVHDHGSNSHDWYLLDYTFPQYIKPIRFRFNDAGDGEVWLSQSPHYTIFKFNDHQVTFVNRYYTFDIIKDGEVACN